MSFFTKALLVLSASFAFYGPETARAQFTEMDAGLPDLREPAVAWGDYDNDGDLDLLLTGKTSSGMHSDVYRNDAGSFTAIGAGLLGLWQGSADWGDYDNDGDLDILLTGATVVDGGRTRLYRNDSGVFALIASGVESVADGSGTWGDYDNDGDLDILLTGKYLYGLLPYPISRVYRNDGGQFTDTTAGLVGIHVGTAVWGDYDNDGDLDILLAGRWFDDWTNGKYCRLYSNTGGLFTVVGAGLTAVQFSALAWGDYDTDGDLDIALTGWTGSDYISRVYRNDSGIFTDIAAGLTGVDRGTVSWGDFDHDGDLDLLLTGWTGSAYLSEVYRNDSGSFVGIGAEMTGVVNSAAAWADYDNDGDLDILISGETETGYASLIYRNDAPSANVPPSAPQNLTASWETGPMVLSWDAATDAESPTLGLSYNIRVGTTPGGSEIVSAMASGVDGQRRIVRLGNAQKRTSWRVRLPIGDYYWSVQAVDGCYAGSEFAPEAAFTAPGFREIATDLAAVDYSCVAWGDYDNDGDLDLLLTGWTGSNEISLVHRNDGGVFTDIGAGLTGVDYSSAAWGDYDNDGDLDILLTGWTGSQEVSLVYRNDDGAFTEISAGLVGVDHSSVAWGDYDNDGDADILLTGWTGAHEVSLVYRNEGGSFVDIGAGLTGVNRGSVAWGDYDNDGDLDILLSGWTGANEITLIYRNDSGSFVDIGAGLLGVDLGSTAWGDYDNDGDLDILLTGWTGSQEVSLVYRNHLGIFTDVEAGLRGVNYSSVAWGDYDNDGDLDILLAGWTGSEAITTVYSNIDGRFLELFNFANGVNRGSVVWGDHDNDGDLDILMSGWTGSQEITRLYRNENFPSNTPPTAPSNLVLRSTGTSLDFSWDAATDSETPVHGLTYNLRVGTSPTGSDICSAMAIPASGSRLTPALGNANQNLSWTVELPSPPTLPIYWSIQAIDTGFLGSPFAAEAQYDPNLTNVPGAGSPLTTALWQCVPNPFNPRTTITYSIPQAGYVELAIYDFAGRHVNTLVSTHVADGEHHVQWDGKDSAGSQVASGVYLYRLRAGDFVETKRMVLLK